GYQGFESLALRKIRGQNALPAGPRTKHASPGQPLHDLFDRGQPCSTAKPLTYEEKETFSPLRPSAALRPISPSPSARAVDQGKRSSSGFSVALDDGHDLVVAQQVPRSLGGLEDRLDEPWAGLEAPLLEPVGDVRCSAHEADRDLLPAPEGARRNPAVDAIGEPLVALLHRLDDRGGVDAGRGAERVAPDQRIVERDVPAHGARHGLAVLDERGQIALRGQLAEEPQVEQEELDGGVADALAEAERRSVYAIGSGLERPEGVAEREPAIVVAVPVEAGLRPRAHDDAGRELDQVSDAVGRGVTHGVREHEPPRAVIDRRAKERIEHLGARARGVFGDVRDREARLDRQVDRLGAPLRDERDLPLLHELADRARADERAHFDLDARLLADIEDRRDVGGDRAAGAGDADRELARSDLLAECEHVVEGALAAPREADVRVLDLEPVHQVQNA